MKHLLLVSAMALGITAVAQNTNAPVAPAFKRVLLGINASPDYCYRTLGSSTQARSNDLAIERWNASDKPKFGSSAGVNVQYNFTPHWGLGLGLQYANRGYITNTMIKYVYLGMAGQPIPDNITYRYDQHFMDIPIRLVFTAGKQRVRFVASVGVAGNVYLNSSVMIQTENPDASVEHQRIEDPRSHRAVNLSAIGSVGAIYRLADRSFLQLEPTFRRSLFPIIDSDILSSSSYNSIPCYLWSCGLDLTFYYALK